MAAPHGFFHALHKDERSSEGELGEQGENADWSRVGGTGRSGCKENDAEKTVLTLGTVASRGLF